jgi:hypothetical protein
MMPEPSTESLIIWMVTFLMVVGVMFWAFFKAIKSRNAKYGYVIFGSILVMGMLLFI